jgi:hypothetical protein
MYLFQDLLENLHKGFAGASLPAGVQEIFRQLVVNDLAHQKLGWIQLRLHHGLDACQDRDFWLRCLLKQQMKIFFYGKNTLSFLTLFTDVVAVIVVVNFFVIIITTIEVENQKIPRARWNH